MDQQCLSCGRDTAAGTELFGSRKRGLDREANVEGYLCYRARERPTPAGSSRSRPVGGTWSRISSGASLDSDAAPDGR